jgi:putative Mg2+ transporter-C (MgtC) family protein
MADLSELEIVLRLLLAAGLGAAIGVEREADGKDAGLRTHLILALGAAVFGVVSVGGWDDFITSGRTNVQVDVTRVASYVAAGIGFIGGGAILKQAGSVKGLTTAASLWIAAAVGLAAGVGLWMAAVTGTFVALLSLVALRPLRNVLRRMAGNETTLTVVIRKGASPSSVLREIEEAGITPAHVKIGPGQSNDSVEVVAEYEGNDPAVVGALAARVGDVDGVSDVYVGRT